MLYLTLVIQIAPGENDTRRVLQELSSAPTHSTILQVLSSIHGPWSFVFWQVSILSTNPSITSDSIFQSVWCVYRHRVRVCGLVGMCLVVGVLSGTFPSQQMTASYSLQWVTLTPVTLHLSVIATPSLDIHMCTFS